jgi:hypothetical protein
LQQKLSLQDGACHRPLPTVGADEVSGEVVIVQSLSYILLLMVPEQVWDWHFCSYQCVFFVLCLFFVSPCLVLSVASWGSVNLAVSSSSWEWRFLYSHERYVWKVCLYLSYFGWYGIAILQAEQPSFSFCSLRGKVQVRSLLCFVIEEPPENADNKRAFK